VEWVPSLGREESIGSHRLNMATRSLWRSSEMLEVDGCSGSRPMVSNFFRSWRRSSPSWSTRGETKRLEIASLVGTDTAKVSMQFLRLQA